MFNGVAIKESGRGVVDVDLDGVHTNLVMVKMVKPGLTSAEFCSRLAQVCCCAIHLLSLISVCEGSKCT